MLRVLIAEDSLTIQRTLSALLQNVEGITIVGIAATGRQAVDMCHELKPDVVTMDIFMPEIDGIEATRLIMKNCPTKIVIISAMISAENEARSFEAIRAGAVEVIEKPRGVLTGNYSEIKQRLVQILTDTQSIIPGKQLSELSTRTPHNVEPAPALQSSEQSTLKPTAPNIFTLVPEIICIGGSTGAPAIIMEMLSTLPSDYPYPIVVAQHISRGFSVSLAAWLDSTLALSVSLAKDGEKPAVGHIHIIPDDSNMHFRPDKTYALSTLTSKGFCIPSIDLFFSSAAEFYGNKAVGVILSGMGNDGASGITEMRNAGALTIAQDKKSSIVYGMANEAVKMNGVVKSCTPTEIAQILIQLNHH